MKKKLTLKQEALKRIYKFYKIMPLNDTKLTSCGENKELIMEMEMLSAKQCAIISIDEQIEFINYLKLIKEEINKLKFHKQ